MKKHPAPDASGFSLIEVMVATAFLALTMTALFSSQVTSFYTIDEAKHLSTATFLARCKMSEIEAHLIKDGLQLDTESEDGECCEAGGGDGFVCHWTIEPPDLEALESEEALGGAADEAGAEAGGEESALASLTSGASAQDMLQGSAAVGSGDIVSGLASEFVWPLLVPSVTEQVRKVTVEVSWGEGDEVRTEEFVQYLVAEVATDPEAATRQEGETP
jgi:hypothetical protein